MAGLVSYDQKGYCGSSMSQNAVSAYENGEMPKSKWTKKAMVSALQDFCDDNYLVFDESVCKMLKDEIFYKFFHWTSWHHTGKFANETDFYGIDEDDAFAYFREMSDIEIQANKLMKRFKWDGERKMRHKRDAELKIRKAVVNEMQKAYFAKHGYYPDSLMSFMTEYPEFCAYRKNKKGTEIVSIPDLTQHEIKEICVRSDLNTPNQGLLWSNWRVKEAKESLFNATEEDIEWLLNADFETHGKKWDFLNLEEFINDDFDEAKMPSDAYYALYGYDLCMAEIPGDGYLSLQGCTDDTATDQSFPAEINSFKTFHEALNAMKFWIDTEIEVYEDEDGVELPFVKFSAYWIEIRKPSKFDEDEDVVDAYVNLDGTCYEADDLFCGGRNIDHVTELPDLIQLPFKINVLQDLNPDLYEQLEKLS